MLRTGQPNRACTGLVAVNRERSPAWTPNDVLGSSRESAYVTVRPAAMSGAFGVGRRFRCRRSSMTSAVWCGGASSASRQVARRDGRVALAATFAVHLKRQRLADPGGRAGDDNGLVGVILHDLFFHPYAFQVGWGCWLSWSVSMSANRPDSEPPGWTKSAVIFLSDFCRRRSSSSPNKRHANFDCP